MSTMAGDSEPNSTTINVEDLAEYQEIRTEDYNPFNLGPESPAQNQFFSDKDVYPEWPALFSTKGTRFPKRASPGPIDWDELKQHVTFDEHPLVVKVIAARFRKDFPLECKAIDETSWERLPYYFDDLDIYQWGPKFLRRVLQCICEEKSILHANILRFAIHLIATDPQRARQMAYFGRAIWYREESAQYGADFLEEMTKFMTHRDDVIQKLTDCANKYLEEARGDSYMRPMYYDEVFQKLNEARAARLRHSVFKGPVLMHNIPAPLAPNWTGRSSKSDTQSFAKKPTLVNTRNQKHEEVLPSSRVGQKSSHRRRTSSLGNEDSAAGQYDSTTMPMPSSLSADAKTSHPTPRSGLTSRNVANKPDVSAKGNMTSSTGNESVADNNISSKVSRHEAKNNRMSEPSTGITGSSTPAGVEGTRADDTEKARSDDKRANSSHPAENGHSDDSISGGGSMNIRSGNQKQSLQQNLPNRAHQKQSGHQKVENRKHLGQSQKPVTEPKQDSNSISASTQHTHGAVQDVGASAVKPSKGKKKNRTGGRKGSGLRNEARIASSPATFAEVSSDHTRKSSASRSIFDEDDSIISVTIEGEKRVSPTLSPQVHTTQPRMPSQDYRIISGSSIDSQPRMRPLPEPQPQPSEHIYAHEPPVFGAQQWQQDPMGTSFQPPMPYMIAQNNQVTYDTEYQTQWAPVYPQPPMHVVGTPHNVVGAPFHGSNPPFANQGYHQQQLFNPQSGSFQPHNHTFQHYQHNSHYDQRENRKRYPETLRYNYDRFSNRRWNAPRTYPRAHPQNTGSTYGAPFDRSVNRNVQHEYNSSGFDHDNRTEAQGTRGQNYRANDEHQGWTSSEDPIVSLPVDTQGRAATEMVSEVEATANIKYPITYPAAQQIPNTPVISRDMSTSASPMGVQNKTAYDIDLDAVNVELQAQSKDISPSEEVDDGVPSQLEIPLAVHEQQSDARPGTENVSNTAVQQTDTSLKEKVDNSACSPPVTDGSQSVEDKAVEHKLIPDTTQSEEDAQFPSLKFAATQAKPKYHRQGHTMAQKAKANPQPTFTKQEQAGLGNGDKSAQSSQMIPSLPDSPKETTTVVTIPAGRRSPSSRLPHESMRFPTRDITDPYKLYVCGYGLDDNKLAKIFAAYQPVHMSTTKESNLHWKARLNVPMELRFAFVTFDSIDKCTEVKKALSGETREGVSLRVDSAMTKFDNSVVEKKFSTTVATTQGSQTYNTKVDADAKHKKSVSISSNKGNASGSHSPKEIAGAATKLTKDSRKKGSIETAKSAAASSQLVTQLPVLPKPDTDGSDEPSPTKQSDDEKKQSMEQSKQVEVTDLQTPKTSKTEFQMVAVPKNSPSEDMHHAVTDSDAPSPATSDHPPVASRIKKNKTKQGKKQKHRPKKISVGNTRDVPLSSSSSDFPPNSGVGEASSFATTVEDDTNQMTENEIETEAADQSLVPQPSMTEQKTDSMDWESTGRGAEANKVETGKLVNQDTTKALETEVPESEKTQSQSTVDLTSVEPQVLDLELSVVLSDASDETIGHEEHPQSIRVTIVNPTHNFLQSSSSEHTTAGTDSEESVTFEKLVKDGEGIERIIDQYHQPSSQEQDNGSRDAQEQLESVESGSSNARVAIQDPAEADSDRHSGGGGNATTSPVENKATNDKANEEEDHTQGWDASVRVSNGSAQKKRRRSGRKGKNTNTNDGNGQAGAVASSDNRGGSHASPNTDTGSGTSSVIKNHTSA